MKLKLTGPFHEIEVQPEQMRDLIWFFEVEHQISGYLLFVHGSGKWNYAIFHSKMEEGEERCTYCKRNLKRAEASIQGEEVMGVFCSIPCLNHFRFEIDPLRFPLSYGKCLLVLKKIPKKVLQDYFAKRGIFNWGPKAEIDNLLAQMNWTPNMHEDLVTLAKWHDLQYKQALRKLRKLEETAWRIREMNGGGN